MPAPVLVPPPRWERWVANFGSRHGAAVLLVGDGAMTGTAEDGSTFVARPPFGREYDGPAEPVAFVAACVPPADWGVLLVRKGGFAIARLAGDRMTDSKTGQRHVQGRTKAGGQSQQRFARRRDNQARQAYEAAAGHAVRILSGLSGPLVAGGDRAAVEAVLEEPALRALAGLVVEPWLPVPDPRRRVLGEAVGSAGAIRVAVDNAD